MRYKTFTIRNSFFRRTEMLVLFLFVFVSLLHAQVRTVTGIVTAADTKETLPGASIVIQGTTTGTTTDIDGKYSLSGPSAKDTLVYSYMGYETQKILVGAQNVIDVTLQLSKISLQEIVVIGYGTVKKSDLSGSVSSIKAGDITKITAANPVQSLPGRVSGVQVTSISGTPGKNPVVRIRGVGTFNNAGPIYVVDGVILDDISFLNPDDIASLEVLKDASATAIYGSRGANGVIMVTTKIGQAKEGKTVFHFNGEYGIQKLGKKIDLLNGKEFAEIVNDIDPGTYNNVDKVPDVDWQDLIFHTAPIQNYEFSASGATKNIQFYISGGYFNQQGIIDKSSYEKIMLRFNNTYNLTDFLKFGNNLSIVPYKQQIEPNATYAAYRAQPVSVPYYPDGSFGAVPGVGNPLAELAYSNNFNKGLRTVGNIYAEATFLKDFVFKSSFGIDGNYNKGTNFLPAFTVYDSTGSATPQNNELSRLTKVNSDNLTWLWENTLTYNKEFKKHSINAVAGYTMQKSRSEIFNLQGANIIRDSKDFWYIDPNYVYDPANGVNTINDIYTKVDPGLFYSMISYLFRVNYTYSGKYILTATFRSDGSSKFSKQNRFSNFPSFAAGWNISEENFMKNIKFINKMKLRASWGKIGNEKIDYLKRFSTVENVITIFGQNGSPNSGASYAVKGNPDLRWEETSQTDVGFELGVLNNRLTAELDYYNRQTNDILIELLTPGYYGNGQGQKVTFNAAQVLNRGFEFNVGWRDQVNEFKYGVSVLGSTVYNEVLAIGGNSGIDSVLIGGFLGNGQSVTRSQVGLPIGAFYGFKTDGIFQTQEEINAYPHMDGVQPGDFRFVDINGDGKISDLDRTYLGSPIPKFIFGFNFDMGYKGFDFSLSIQGQTGNKIFNAKEVVRPDLYNFEKHVLDRWTGPGTSNTEPAHHKNDEYNYNPSDYFIYDGSFLRIRNVVLGYTLPGKWTNKAYVQKLRLYVKVDNLHTFTKFTGYTPEIGSDDALGQGIDTGIYPVTSVYSVGINLTF